MQFWWNEHCGNSWMFKHVLLPPICPHYAEYVWKVLLKNDGYVVKAGWPETDALDLTRSKKANKYLQDSIVSMRKLLQKLISGSKKGNTSTTNVQKLCMLFLRFKKDEVRLVGVQALDLKLPFGEIEVLAQNAELI